MILSPLLVWYFRFRFEILSELDSSSLGVAIDQGLDFQIQGAHLGVVHLPFPVSQLACVLTTKLEGQLTCVCTG